MSIFHLTPYSKYQKNFKNPKLSVIQISTPIFTALIDAIDTEINKIRK